MQQKARQVLSKLITGGVQIKSTRAAEGTRIIDPTHQGATPFGLNGSRKVVQGQLRGPESTLQQDVIAIDLMTSSSSSAAASYATVAAAGVATLARQFSAQITGAAKCAFVAPVQVEQQGAAMSEHGLPYAAAAAWTFNQIGLIDAEEEDYETGAITVDLSAAPLMSSPAMIAGGETVYIALVQCDYGEGLLDEQWQQPQPMKYRNGVKKRRTCTLILQRIAAT